ncbi:lamin tail domain-containing protein [Streptomyces sp. NPDC090052]|uniref:lamin tail domain-containing protein n=1 Tax=unclassified Streptomyces TaxID=2593676 RepID=UPI00381CFA7C
MSSLSSGSRLAAAVLASGALLAAAFPAAAADHHHPASRPERSAVVVGAVHHIDSHGRGHHRGNRVDAEWITVTNNSRRPVELRGWTLSDAQHHSYRFHALRLGAHKSVKVHTGHGRDTWNDVYQNRRAPIWDRVDTATLRDARGHVVDVERLGHRHH